MILTTERTNNIEGSIRALEIVEGFFKKVLEEDIEHLSKAKNESEEELLEGNIDNLKTLVDGISIEIRAAKQIL